MSGVHIDNITPIHTATELKNPEIRIAPAEGLLGPKAFKVKSESRIVGMRTIILAVAAMGIAFNTLGIALFLDRSNELKEEEVKIQKEQLDLARRQFQLDSIAAVKNQKNR